MRKLGVEIENNSTTPMEAVVELNEFVFGWKGEIAFENMLKTHLNGRSLVAVFPENRLHDIEQRLQTFVAKMQSPVAYRIVEGPSDELGLEVDFASLLDWGEYHERKLVSERRSMYRILVFGIIIAALFISAWLYFL